MPRILADQMTSSACLYLPVCAAIFCGIGCFPRSQSATETMSAEQTVQFESSQLGAWHQWHIPSNMTSSGYCIVKFEYDSSDAGDAWLYKLDGQELRPVHLLARNINATLDLDTIYETTSFVEILLTYRQYHSQVMRYDLASKSVVRNYKTNSGPATNPIFPQMQSDPYASSSAIISDLGPIYIWGIQGKGESIVSLVSPKGTVTHRMATIYNAALVDDKDLLLDFGQRETGDLGMVAVPVERLMGKDLERHFRPIRLIPARR